MTTQEARAQAQHLYLAAQSKDGSCDLEQFTGRLLNLLRTQDRDTRLACANNVAIAHSSKAQACINTTEACP